MRLNFLLGVCAVVMLAVAGGSCSKKGSDGDGGVAIQPNGWKLISWNDHTALSGHVYLELEAERFTLYQQIGNLTSAGYVSYTGSCRFTADSENGTILSGVYSDGEPWARSYRVESMTDTELRLVSLDEQIESIYERVVIPDYVKEAPVSLPSRSGTVLPLL